MLLLASGSPRRSELLKTLKIPFSIIVPDVDESPLENENHIDYVLRVSKDKALHVSNQHKNFSVIAADTIVFNGKILGKPKNEKAAFNMIASLSGKTHSVMTGVTIIRGEDQKTVSFYVETTVTFKKLTEEDIRSYVKSDEPYDKAGGYAIQGMASVFISEINGCYHNVMGFPLVEIEKQLKALHIS